MRGSAVALVLALALAGCNVDASTPTAGGTNLPRAEDSAPPTASPRAHVGAVAAVPPRRPRPRPTPSLLFPAPNGDGDSWKDTSGVEYRLGLVNTPELSECYGETASAERKRLTAGGFRAKTYTVDRYGRHVSVVYLADGTNLNVFLARHGYANDKYLAEFRSENPSLAAQLDAAFAAAKREKLGLWSACRPAAPQGFAAASTDQTASGCHPAYSTCIPVKGDGSGNGWANDLDCGDIRRLVLIKQVGVDPYRLDGSDQDGRGCESYA